MCMAQTQHNTTHVTCIEAMPFIMQNSIQLKKVC